MAASAVVRGQLLVLNSTFPRVVLPLSSVYGAAARFPYQMAIYFGIHAAFGRGITAHLVWFIPIFVMFSLFAVGLGLFLSALMVEVRDTKQILPFLMRAILCLSPVVYEASRVPASLKPLIMANPLYPAFAAIQEVIRGSSPTVEQLCAASAWALCVAVAGFMYFVSRERHFAVRL
jgi:teichoic acid transport system permease protein